MFYIFFSICFVCYVLRTVFNILKYRRHALAEIKAVVISVFIIMFVLWFSWFQMCFVDPFKMIIPQSVSYFGLVVFIIGILLFILSHTAMRGFVDKGKLVTTGIYSRIRNPMYLGFILWVISFPIFTKSLGTLVSDILWIPFIIYWKLLEEKEMEQKYAEYGEYKERTWF